MYDATVKDWRGATWYPTNLLPTITLHAAVGATDGGVAGGLLEDDTYYVIVTKVNPLTGKRKCTTIPSHKE